MQICKGLVYQCLVKQTIFPNPLVNDERTYFSDILNILEACRDITFLRVINIRVKAVFLFKAG